jgi:3alpha(or 20beta)-hydroxysteroid dehydrogenase
VSGADGRFAGKVALVTGAAAGQGAATARRLAAEGASLVLGDRDEGPLDGLVAELDGSVGVGFDVGDEAGWECFAAAAVDSFGRIDVLVNNAGAYVPRPLADTDAELAQGLFLTNQLGPLLGMRAVSPHMRISGGGSIVNISSTAGLIGAAGVAAYAATKWALRGLSKTAAAELGPDGIRVNCVIPGLIDTAMAALNTDDVNRELIGRAVLGRIGEPDEVVAATCFLAADESGYITGAELVVDGGATIA